MTDAGEAREPGTLDDNLPFSPDGTRLGSIAWRTWVYTDVGPKRHRYGYLRAGQVVDARGPAIKNAGCAGGWYRINPRGFVCIGKGATLDLQHPVIVQNSVRPKRGEGLPYVYAMAGKPPPLLYFKLQSRERMLESEGDYAGRVFRLKSRLQGRSLPFDPEAPSAPPGFLDGGGELVKPYGVESPLRYVNHAGRANGDSGFAVQRVFGWEDRLFGLTTGADLIALDNTRVVVPSALRGIELSSSRNEVGFVMNRYAPRQVIDDEGRMAEEGHFAYRQGVELTGKVRRGGFVETVDGSYLAGAILREIEPRLSFPSFATGKRRWIDISIQNQTLVAYEGKRAVFATLISSGRGGMADPSVVEEATVRGTFMIHSKHVTATMDGDDDHSDSFNLHDVPFVQYFHKGYALHGAYWHDEFGKMRSHGCVNLSPADAAWLFEWTSPSVPEGWHGALNKERGTVVHIRP